MSNNFHLQLYRGTTAQNDAYTGLSGEVTVDTTLSKLRLHDGSTKGGVEIGGMPVGSIIPYAGTTIPAGYLLCDGSAISRTTYSALFASIGTTYGAGDGNSTFNLPTKYDCGNMLPSSNYVNLTLGASGSTYTAPVNGWLFLDKVAESGQWIELIVRNNNDIVYYKYTHASSSQPIQLLMPIEKGRICDINYTATGTTNTYRFIYTEGQQSIIKY